MSQVRALSKLAGNSTAVREIIEEVERASSSDVRVLISGDTGIGKGAIAQCIHEQSARHLGPFVAMTCAAAGGDLLDSLENANQGTLFMDEIGELDSHLQDTLLTFLETSELRRDGTRPDTTADVRIIAASGRDLHHDVVAGRFSATLFYRLNVIHILVPASRGRARAVSRHLDESQPQV